MLDNVNRKKFNFENSGFHLRISVERDDKDDGDDDDRSYFHDTALVIKDRRVKLEILRPEGNCGCSDFGTAAGWKNKKIHIA